MFDLFPEMLLQYENELVTCLFMLFILSCGEATPQ